MKTIMVRYKTSAAGGDTNVALVRAVFEELELRARRHPLRELSARDGVRALVSDDCRLDLVSKSQRRGKQVGAYFARYEKESVALRVVNLEGRLAFAVHVAGAERPAYFILVEIEAGRVAAIRDFRYVTYIAAEADFAAC
jgi:hypothetical protein